jgi:hypothetical protein
LAAIGISQAAIDELPVRAGRYNLAPAGQKSKKIINEFISG